MHLLAARTATAKQQSPKHKCLWWSDLPDYVSGNRKVKKKALFCLFQGVKRTGLSAAGVEAKIMNVAETKARKVEENEGDDIMSNLRPGRKP